MRTRTWGSPVLHDQEEGYQQPITLSMRCPKSQFPIWIVVFDELELIFHVIQGLSLSTASLVFSYYKMHPWKNIIKGNTVELNTKACFICLERIPCSDDDIELKLHLYRVHSSKAHLKELVEMCTEAKEREEREGWNIDDILEEEWERREAQERQRAESGGWMVILRKKNMPEFLDNSEEAELDEVNCFLCQEKLIVNSCEYSNHLEKQHGVIFGVKEIMKAGEKYQSIPSNEEPDHETGEAESNVFRTDAETVKELVEMKFLTKKRKIRLRSPRQRIFSRKYKVLLNN